jgi:hypothetical protein
MAFTRSGNFSALSSLGVLRKSLSASLANDFWTSLQNGEWKRTASNESRLTFLPHFCAAADFCRYSWNRFDESVSDFF